MTVTHHRNRPAGPVHVVFDFDLTLVDHESTYEALRIATANDPAGARYCARIRALAERVSSKTASRAEFFELVWAATRFRRRHIATYVQRTRAAIDPAILRTLDRLRQDGARLHVLSSGYQEAVAPLAQLWGIAGDDITANRFVWLGERALTARPSALQGKRGKADIIRRWRDAGRIDGTVVMVGDSQPDYLAYRDGPTDGFVSADYYATRPLTLDKGNISRAGAPSELYDCIRDVLARAGQAGRRGTYA